MKVIYNSGSRFKWISMNEMENMLRPSKRPKPPPTMRGTFMKETHNFFTTLHERYFELNRGFMQWWVTEAEAKSGAKPNGSLYLLGMKLQVDGANIMLKTDSSQGMLYKFVTPSDELCKTWVEALWTHAGFCLEMRELLHAQEAGSQMRQELLNIMNRKGV